MPAKTVLILGAGTGGLVAANRLRRLLPREHRVVLIDRSPIYTFAPSYTWVMLGKRDGGRISRDLRRLARKGIEFVMGEVAAIDFANKKVQLREAAAEQELVYDYLVVSLGAEYSSDEIPGLGQSWTFYHLDGAEGLREKLPTVHAGHVAIVVSGLPYKCPPAPYEGALLLGDYFRRRKLRESVDIHVYTPETVPLRAAGDNVGQALMEMLAQRGVGFTGGASLAEVDQRARTMRFADGASARFDLLIATPLHRVPAVLVASGLSQDGAWITVDRETLATGVEDVYAIGDVTNIPLWDGVSLPKAGVFAHGQAEVVARNIAAEIAGADPIWAFGGQGACFLEAGGGKAAYVVGNFYAEPRPDVALRHPSRLWHWAKMGFERVWLWRWF